MLMIRPSVAADVSGDSTSAIGITFSVFSMSFHVHIVWSWSEIHVNGLSGFGRAFRRGVVKVLGSLRLGQSGLGDDWSTSKPRTKQ